MRRGLASAVLAALAVLTAFSTAPAGAATHQIPIAQYSYMPPAMTVRVGDVVTWTNQDQAPHDVAAGTFRSPMLETGQSWSYTFTQPGTFDYVCSIHPDMRARITVLAAETTQPLAREPVQTTTEAAAAPTTTTTAATTTAVAAAVVPAQKPNALDPMLLLAGLVAAVTTLCLLLIGSRPDRA
ncbi:copper-binding protein [Lentzea tibetensis]|uniref:Copper-binding protein n=1 Tax=Lentzea tibetensis TaxID=2591470 RepID=A0A563EZ43_9PSEU|nr:cupredoxin family copper-binding protein [Lentzea tibetensis]TWP52939.1 copper-binding protein [Lentzea tibetensis]